jgi:hypothetical protein
VALPTEIGTDGQRPLLVTKGNPTSSRGCYQIEHHLYQVYLLSTRCRRGLPATSSASVVVTVWMCCFQLSWQYSGLALPCQSTRAIGPIQLPQCCVYLHRCCYTRAQWVLHDSDTPCASFPLLPLSSARRERRRPCSGPTIAKRGAAEQIHTCNVGSEARFAGTCYTCRSQQLLSKGSKLLLIQAKDLFRRT